MDTNLAYMYKMVEKSQGNFRLDKKILADYGAKVELFPGVKTWFKRIRNYGKKHNIIIEHYIISSGLKEMIEGTVMAQAGEFEKIYASSFYFDDNGIAKWPAQAVNYTGNICFTIANVDYISKWHANFFFRYRIIYRRVIYI